MLLNVTVYNETMTENKQTVAVCRAFVVTALSTDLMAAKAAVKEINNQKYRDGEWQKSVIFEFLPPDPAILADPRRYENFLKLLGVACWSRKAVAHKEVLAQETWRGLEHPNGMVRQAARRLFDQVRSFATSHESLSQSAEHYISLLKQIESKIEQHRPANPPLCIEKAPASVYKTLTMLWYDIAFIPIVEARIDPSERMMQLDIMPYSDPLDEDETPIEEFELEDWQEHIEEYVRCDDPAKTRVALKQREKQALVYLKQVLADLDLGHLAPDITKFAAQGEQEGIGELLERVLKPVLLAAPSEKEGILTAFRYNKFARSLQYYANNVVHTSSKGTPFSNEIVEAVYCADENIRPEIIPLDSFCDNFEAAHQGLDDFMKQCVMPAIKKQQKQDEIFRKKYGEFPETTLVDLFEPIQIAHYLLDKIPCATYKLFMTREPRKIAATIWKIVADDNFWLSIPGLDSATLSAFGGWKSESGVHSSVLSYRYNIAQTTGDPSIGYVVRDADDLELFSQQKNYI